MQDAYFKTLHRCVHLKDFLPGDNLCLLTMPTPEMYPLCVIMQDSMVVPASHLLMLIMVIHHPSRLSVAYPPVALVDHLDCPGRPERIAAVVLALDSPNEIRV